jgi:hypothetical protein
VSTRNPEESTGRPQVDVAAAVRRGQRGFVIRLAGMWVAVLAATVVLILVGAVARSYLGVPSVPGRLNPVTSQGVGAQVILVAAALLAAAGLAQAVLREVRRGQRGFVMRHAGMWVAVLAATVVLILVGAVARSYLGAPSVPGRLSLATPQAAGVLLAAAAAMAAAGVFTLTARRRRIRSPARSRQQTAVAADVRVVPDTSRPDVLGVRDTGQEPTHTVRFEPHPGVVTVTIKEVWL